MVIVILIFFVMVVGVGTAAVGGFSLYLKRRAARLRAAAEKKRLDQPPPYRGLFESTAEEIKSFQQEENSKASAARGAISRQMLIERANDDELQVLTETTASGELELYRELLALLTKRAAAEIAKLVSLAEFVSKNELPTSEDLAQSLTAAWEKDSSIIPVSKVLHVAALSDSAETYSQMIDRIIAARKEKDLGISGTDLYALFETHYWLLSNENRASGGGFLLKGKLAELCERLS